MIVDSAIGTTTWEILQAIKGGFIDEHDDLPDSVLQALHDLDAEVEKATDPTCRCPGCDEMDCGQDHCSCCDHDMAKAAGNADHLKRYWAHGAGAGKIAWGTEGDFARCVAHVGKYMDSPEGYCNLRHKEATGQYPSQHAAAQRKKKGVKKAVTLVEKFNPNHDGRGRFATHSGMRVGATKDDAKAQASLVEDGTRMAGLPEDLQAQMHTVAAGMGTDRAALEANIEATYQRAIDRTGNPPRGHDWYEQANRECASVAADTGMQTHQATGMVAAISPQMAWGPNLAVARFAAENQHTPIDMNALAVMSERKGLKGGPRSAYDWAKAEVDGRKIDGVTRVMPPLSALQGKTFHDLDPYVAAALLKAHAQAGSGVFNGKALGGKALSIADDITGKVQRVNFPPTIQTGRGLRIARGEDANLILNGHKVRSFRNNLTNPTDRSGDITVDSHAVSLALGRKISSGSVEYKDFSSKPTSATLGVKGSYALWADAYRSVAERHGIRPNQLQSITWIQWRHEHPDNARTTHAMD